MKKLIPALLSASFFVISPSSHSSVNWSGTMEGISHACMEKKIVINADLIQFEDCESQPFQTLEQKGELLLIRIDGEANCRWKGSLLQFLLENKYGSKMVQVKAFASKEDQQKDNFRLMCMYDYPRQ